MHANGRPADAREHLRKAADGFRTWGQPLDAQRRAELVSRVLDPITGAAPADA